MLQIETPDVRSPEQIEVRLTFAVPPQPQNPRLAPPLATGQTLDLHQDERTDHDGQGSATASLLVVPDFGM